MSGRFMVMSGSGTDAWAGKTIGR